jgi:hypothetical protein
LVIFQKGSCFYALAGLDCAPPIYASHKAEMTGTCPVFICWDTSCDPPDFCLLTNQDYSCEPPCPRNIHVFYQTVKIVHDWSNIQVVSPHCYFFCPHSLLLTTILHIVKESGGT